MTGRINVDHLRVMAAGGMKAREIADHFGVQPQSVRNLAWRHGIMVTHQRSVFVPPKVAPKRPAHLDAPKPASQGKAGQLLATRGKYAALAAWAVKWGVAVARANAEWLKVRP